MESKVKCLISARCYALDVTNIDNGWREISKMVPKFGLENFMMVPYGDKLYAVGGFQNQRRTLSEKIKQRISCLWYKIESLPE